MKIIYTHNDNEQVAHDDADGTFYIGDKGAVFYLGPGEIEPWYVNASFDLFKKVVQVYDRYVDEVVGKESEQDQLDVVANFREALWAVESQHNQSKSFWACIIQQAEDGQI
jgi:hypothetical protein